MTNKIIPKIFNHINLSQMCYFSLYQHVQNSNKNLFLKNKITQYAYIIIYLTVQP